VSFASLYARLRTRLRLWALRGKSPEPQPVTLRQARVYVFPTGTGLAIVGTLLLMFIGAINYALSLGFGLTFFLGSVGVVHILHSWRTLTGLQISLLGGGETFAGTRAQWVVSLTNHQDTARPAVRIGDTEGHAQLLADVLPRTTTQLTLSLPCPHRGWMQPGICVIETRQPLGWIRAWSYIAPDAPLLVYPEPRGKLPLPAQTGVSAEGVTGTAPGQDDFAGLRAYQPGDSLRHVAWKQLASGQGMYTKMFASGMGTGCTLDWFALPTGMDTEARLSQLTQWVLESRTAGLRITLVLPGGQIGPGHDQAHYQECLRQLALYGLEGLPHG